MVKWHSTRLPKLEGEDEITSMFEAALNLTFELGFQYCAFTLVLSDQTTKRIL
jgi:LuxR family transcriptional regulator